MNELPISISIIDVKGKVNNGVVLLLNLMVVDESYEIGYWFNNDKETIIYPEQKLLDYLGISELREYELYDDLVYFIYESIPNKEEIAKEYFK